MIARSLLAFALCAACVQVGWDRESKNEPVSKATLGALEPHRTELGECLRILGAPLWVWEHDQDGQVGAVLAYGWFDERDLGLRLSIPVSRGVSPSLDYSKIDQRMHGVVLFFDQDWLLTAWRTGLLRDLSREARRPTAVLEEEA